MRAMLVVSIFLVLAGGAAWGEEPPASPTWVRTEASKKHPHVTLDRLSGGEAELAGNSVVLHFWATWCGPCLTELPELDGLAGQLGLKVLTISEDRGGAGDVRPYLDHHQSLPHLEMLVDPQRVGARAFGVKVLPTTIVLGPDGQEYIRLIGAGQWQAIDMIERIHSATLGMP